jgi:hypothetical protein
MAVTECLDHRFGWDKLPTPLGLLTLIGLRTKLRRKNLVDMSGLPAANTPPVAPPSPHVRISRTMDGTYNDLASPSMGAAGTRFGRNIPLDKIVDATQNEVLTPNPREVSRALLTRTEFVPATSVNSLVAAWLQFMIHDWFSHGTSPKDNPWVVPLAADDSWPEVPMLIMRTPDDPTRPPNADMPQTRVNVLTHWWDGSQVYGVSAADEQARRSGVDGKLRVLDDGHLPMPSDPDQDPTQKPGFWVGLVMLQTLFSLEHNAICDRLRAAYPSWDDEEIFQRVRLVNSALIAKIHTIDWTPAIIAHPTTKFAMRANWFGLLGERFERRFGRITGNDLLQGIPGSGTEHHGVPYSLTEEFVAVYRMHPLIPDDVVFRAVDDDRQLARWSMPDLLIDHVRQRLSETPMEDLFYSFGRAHPGAITLHNYPNGLRRLQRVDGLLDLAAADILRVRERGVPRYNEFRRLLRLAPAATFEELTGGDRALAVQLRDVYGDVERVDLMIGLYAEPMPAGFGFSDTAFRVFILMASRRLKSDRFLSRDFRAEVYTEAGMTWIRDADMRAVLLRHFKSLAPALAAVANPFAPWTTTAAADRKAHL